MASLCVPIAFSAIKRYHTGWWKSSLHEALGLSITLLGHLVIPTHGEKDLYRGGVETRAYAGACLVLGCLPVWHC